MFANFVIYMKPCMATTLVNPHFCGRTACASISYPSFKNNGFPHRDSCPMEPSMNKPSQKCEGYSTHLLINNSWDCTLQFYTFFPPVLLSYNEIYMCMYKWFVVSPVPVTSCEKSSAPAANLPSNSVTKFLTQISSTHRMLKALPGQFVMVFHLTWGRIGEILALQFSRREWWTSQGCLNRSRSHR